MMVKQARKCTVCGQVKPLSEFYIENRKTTKGIIKKIVRQPCKECTKERERKKYRKKKEKEKYRKEEEKGRWDKYKFIHAGVSYKKVLPPEKWLIIEHFIACFCRLAMEAEAAGKKPDIDRFLKEYRRIYGQEGKEAAMV